jgi:hypothetical protein
MLRVREPLVIEIVNQSGDSPFLNVLAELPGIRPHAIFNATARYEMKMDMPWSYALAVHKHERCNALPERSK